MNIFSIGSRKCVKLLLTIPLLWLPAVSSAADFQLNINQTDRGQYGWRFGDSSNRDRVVGEFSYTGGNLALSVVGYDVDSDTEVSVSLNGRLLGYLPTGRNNRYTAAYTKIIDSSQLVSGTNRLLFRQTGRRGDTWGVTNVSLRTTSSSAPVTPSPSPSPSNTTPVAVDDRAALYAGTNYRVSVLANDSAPNGSLNAETVSVRQGPSSGTAVALSNGQIRYTHNGNSARSDSFTYNVRDNSGQLSNTATVRISLVQSSTPTNPSPPPPEPTPPPPVTSGAPIAVNDGAALYAGTGYRVSVLANDSDPNGSLNPETVSVLRAPSSGTAVALSNGQIRYTHNGNTASSDSFTYAVRDNSGLLSNTATVTIKLVQPANTTPTTPEPPTPTPTPTNAAPVAANDSASVNSGSVVTIGLLGNDFDPDGSLDPLSVRVSSSPLRGSVSLNPNGSVVYSHNGGSSTTDSFTYTVKDGQGLTSNTATVSITVTSVSVSSNLNAFHRSGQTFLTWPETGSSAGYHVYRHNQRITSSNIGSARRLTAKWGPLDSDTSRNFYGGPNVPSHFVINDLAAPLSDDTGLFVHTTQSSDSSTAYYAVRPVVNGVESGTIYSTSSGLSESVAQPRDVLTVSKNNGKGRNYTQFMDYARWNPTFNGYIYNYSVALPASYNSNRAYPLMVKLHAYTNPYPLPPESEYGWDVIQIFPNDPGPTVGAVHSWWHGYAADHNYKTQGSIPSQGRVENFTEQRVMRAILELRRSTEFNINDKLIHGYGSSMGASGMLAMSLRYPKVLSGSYLSQPMTNYSTSPKFKSNVEQLWGYQSSNLRTVNRGPYSESIQRFSTPVWDWMNHHKQVVDRRGDEFAFIMTSHGKLDRVIDWQTQGKPTARAFTNGSLGFTARYRGNYAHQSSQFDSVVTPMFGYNTRGDFPWKYPLNMSFPAIQNASGSSSLSPGDSGDDSYNMDFHWATPHTPFDTAILDQSLRYEITIKSLSSNQVADITPRRTQSFKPAPGRRCNWSTVDRNSGSVTASGSSTVDSDSLITIPGVRITTNTGTRVRIDCS